MAKRDDAPTYQRMLVGSDGSERASRAVARAAELAKSLGASLTVLGVGDEGKLRPALEAQASTVTDGLDIEIVVRSGNAAQALIDEAASGYDFLVVGNKGMSGLERLRLGSVPNKISHHIPCSLLIVKTG